MGVAALTTKNKSLPNFDKPPVREVVCGITFKSLEAFQAPYLGALWQAIRADYPKCVEQPPLAQVIESYERPSPKESVEVLRGLPLPRLWFLSSDETRVLQVQRDRLLHNWKKVRPEDEYPRYPRVVKMFKDALNRFESLLGAEDLGAIEPLQYELTYVNHISIEREWSDLSGIGALLPDLSWRNTPGRFLPSPEMINLRASFVLPERQGRLHINTQNATQVSDQQDIVRLDLTVRGMPPDRSRDSMWQWFDLAREWIVKSFVDITDPQVQAEVWRKL